MIKTSFGFGAVQAGQKNATVNAEPRLIANSTSGKFMITAPVSKALNIAVGENIMFINNVDDVELGVANNHPEVLAWAKENGVDVNTAEGKAEAIKALTIWAIAKGILQYKSNGEPIMGSIRYTKEEKLEAIIARVDEFLSNEDIHNEIAKVMGNADFTTEEFVNVLQSEETDEFTTTVKNCAIAMVPSPQYHSATGSKTATTGSATGVGLQLNFTDTAIWNELKKDLKNDKNKKNRNYKVHLNMAFTTDVNDGQKYVKVTAYPIEFIEDTDPIIRAEKQ